MRNEQPKADGKPFDLRDRTKQFALRAIRLVEALVDAGLVPKRSLEPLIQEARELTAIAVSSIRTARTKRT